MIGILVEADWVVKQTAPMGRCGCHRNAETYVLVGDALGRAMVKLLEARGKAK